MYTDTDSEMTFAATNPHQNMGNGNLLPAPAPDPASAAAAAALAPSPEPPLREKKEIGPSGVFGCLGCHAPAEEEDAEEEEDGFFRQLSCAACTSASLRDILCSSFPFRFRRPVRQLLSPLLLLQLSFVQK
jgi:hypothetical protein